MGPFRLTQMLFDKRRQSISLVLCFVLQTVFACNQMFSLILILLSNRICPKTFTTVERIVLGQKSLSMQKFDYCSVIRIFVFRTCLNILKVFGTDNLDEILLISLKRRDEVSLLF